MILLFVLWLVLPFALLLCLFLLPALLWGFGVLVDVCVRS